MTRDFRLQFFSSICFPRAPELLSIPWGHFEFLRKDAEIFDIKGYHKCQRNWRKFIAGNDTNDKHKVTNISKNFGKKFDDDPTVYSGARGKLIYEKNQKSKISRQTSFNARIKTLTNLRSAKLCSTLLELTIFASTTAGVHHSLFKSNGLQAITVRIDLTSGIFILLIDQEGKEERI